MLHPSLQAIPEPVRLPVAGLAADVVERAASFGDDRWGITPFADGFQVNVGWTEILTALPHGIRLVVDGELASKVTLSQVVTLTEGKDSRGFYPSVPGSLLAVVLYQPIALFSRAVDALSPAVMRAIKSAARRGPGRGVVKGHRQEVVLALAALTARSLPAPGYADDPAPTTMGAALLRLNDGVAVSVAGSRAARLARLRIAPIKSQQVTVTTTVFLRNPDVVAEVLFRSKGACEDCGKPAPFHRASDGSPYLEVHHKVLLSEGGDDTVKNAIALCPNCHRARHFA